MRHPPVIRSTPVNQNPRLSPQLMKPWQTKNIQPDFCCASWHRESQSSSLESSLSLSALFRCGTRRTTPRSEMYSLRMPHHGPDRRTTFGGVDMEADTIVSVLFG